MLNAGVSVTRKMKMEPTIIKQVLVVRADLKMPVGKIASQCAHASMKIFFDRGGVGYTLEGLGGGGLPEFTCDLTQDMATWINGEFTKTVVKVHSEEELKDIHEKALLAGLPTALIEDNGRTCFNGVKTPTVVAIGPCKVEDIDPITGHLKLL